MSRVRWPNRDVCGNCFWSFRCIFWPSRKTIPSSLEVQVTLKIQFPSHITWLYRELSQGHAVKLGALKNLNGKREKNGWRVRLSFLLSNELSWREEAGGRCPASESDQHNKRMRNGNDEASRKWGRFKWLLYSTGFKIEDCLLSWFVDRSRVTVGWSKCQHIFLQGRKSC